MAPIRWTARQLGSCLVGLRAHLRRIDVSLRNHAASQETGDLARIDRVVLGLPAMDGFHIEGVAKDEWYRFPSAEIGERVPGKDTFNRYDEAFTEGFDDLQERLRSGGHVFVQNDLALLIQDTDVHRLGALLVTQNVGKSQAIYRSTRNIALTGSPSM